MADPTDVPHLRNVTQELITAITSPEVIESMRQFRIKAAQGADFSEAGDLMSLEALKAAGAQLPPGFRITSRVFEDKVSQTKIDLGPWLGDDIGATPPIGGAINAVSGCAGGGAGTVCGCAGGGT